MYLYLIPLLIGLFLYYMYRRIYNLNHWSEKGVPYVKPHWFFGNYKKFFLSKGGIANIQENYHAYNDEKLVGVYRFCVPELIVRDPDLIKRILVTDFHHFPDRYNSQYLEGLEDDMQTLGLLVSPEKNWKPIRQKLTPAFTPNKIKAMFPLVKDVADNLVRYIEEKELNSRAVDIVDITSRYTIDVIGSVGFGITANSIYNPDSGFCKALHEITTIDTVKFIRYAIIVSAGFLARALKIRLLPAHLEKFFLNSTESIMEERWKHGMKRSDFIQIFMEMMEQEKLETNTANPNDFIPMNYKFFTAQSLSFFIAGYETTSLTMSSMLHELAYNQDVQEKIYREIVSVLSENGGELTYDAIGKMTYLEMALCENMRKNPVILCMGRYCAVPYTFPGTNIKINKGDMLNIPLMSIQMDPKYYPEPHKFIPERFSAEEQRKRHPMTYIPFGEGPKLCLGKRLAGLQSKTGLISLILNYKIEPSYKSTYEMDKHAPLILITSRNGVWLKFSKR